MIFSIPANAPPILVRLKLDAAPVLGYIAKDDIPSLGAPGPVSMLKIFAKSVGRKFIKGHYHLSPLILKPYDFEPRTLGEHVRKKCLELGLMQKEVAEQLGVNTWTILNWEKGNTESPIASIPVIIQFLGYDPFPKPTTLSQHLFARRREMGWLIKEAAREVGVDPGTWSRWERGQIILYRQHRVLIAQLLGLSVDALNKEMASHWNRSHERVL